MILKGSQRSGAKQLSQHLMNTRDNEHVELFELRGFIADDLEGALQEARAISRGTRCKQFMFSLSLNPPLEGDLDDRGYRQAVDQAEQALGLDGQPRAIVFHEKDGRRHAHVVWSRIDAEKMTAINLPHFKMKLKTLSRDLFLEHGWQLPKGLQDGRQRDPLNFTLAEWQQARRAKMEPKLLKAMFADMWSSTTGIDDLRTKLAERGFMLARGDRRGHVAIDFRGEVYALGRWMPAKTKEVATRLGDPAKLPSVDRAKGVIADRMTSALSGFVKEIEADIEKSRSAFALRKDWIVQKHRSERKALRDNQKSRWERESRERASRLPRGLKALWSWLKGEYAHLKIENKLEVSRSEERDLSERKALFAQHKAEFRELRAEIQNAREVQTERLVSLNADVARYMQLGGVDRSQGVERPRARDLGPSLGL
ncbi:MAG: relaxase/mobilization nuclease domain-containing protein [Pseudomonadota bacterium]